MTPNDQISTLSIIAARLLPSCRESVRKCLKENIFYYLNTDFEISDEGDSIRHRRGYMEAVDDKFFDLTDIESSSKGKPRAGGICSPNNSLSAIVGKNGDGKSSLVEFMLRLINNFACRRGLNQYEHLVYVNGVYGELYYKLNGRFFKISIESQEGRSDKIEFYEFSYDEESKDYRICSPMYNYDPDECIFYTIVSNYSHYAFNTEEFKDEKYSSTKDDLWLHKLFHKNDGYQTPINLHPYREKGNIDINREKLLSTQRLLTVIVKSVLTDMNRKDSGFEVNDKTPSQLVLTDAGFSKLQEITLKGYFKDNKRRNILEEEIKKRFFSDGNRYEYSLKTLRKEIAPILMEIIEKYIKKSKKGFFKLGRQWMDENNLFEGATDINKLIGQIRYANERFGTIGITNVDKYWRQFSKLSAIQFLRLALVHDICRILESMEIIHFYGIEIDPKIIFEKYENLTYEDKCIHYIIYKTITIFESYPAYYNPIAFYGSAEVFFIQDNPNLNEGVLYNFHDALGILNMDWKLKSHVTLKLRQTVNYLRGEHGIKDFYLLEKNKESGRNEKKIELSELTQQQRMLLSEMETLPPPIFKYEVMFKKNGEINLISFKTFSSGEKQKLFFLGSIIYHLQNINSIVSGRIHYHSVNLIFEEIELYFHPEWQRNLVFDLMKAIRSANIPNICSVNMIFVTHSPYILSDIPKSHVLFLKNGAPTYEMQENTFGANINSLLKNGFFLPNLPMGEFAYRKINTLFYKLHSGDFDPRDIDQLYAQIMTVGEPAIRMQLMTLFAAHKKLILTEKEIIEILSNRNNR